MSNDKKKVNLVKRNDNRPNGKAWKKSWGSNPPIVQSRLDSDMNKKKKINYKKESK